MPDLELEAMSRVIAAMEQLDSAAQGRVIKWVSDKLGLSSISAAGSLTNGGAGARTPVDPTKSEGDQFRDFADLFDSARPRTDVDKSLVAGYWVQFCEGNSDFASQLINNALKQLGHPVGNITRALGSLIQTRPSLVQQLRKDGGSRQARKTYRLTNAGQKKVEQMYGGRKEDDN